MEQRGAKGAKGSKVYSILGFRVPTTWNGNSFDFHIQWSDLPTTCKGAKGSKGSEGAVKGSKGGVKCILY